MKVQCVFTSAFLKGSKQQPCMLVEVLTKPNHLQLQCTLFLV